MFGRPNADVQYGMNATHRSPVQTAYVMSAIVCDWANGRYGARELRSPFPPALTPGGTVANALDNYTEDSAYGIAIWPAK